MSSSKPNRRAPLQSTDMDETEEDKSHRYTDNQSEGQSLHNFDSSSIHTTDFLSTTTDVEEWPGMATNPNTPKVERNGKESRKAKKSVDRHGLETDGDEIMRKMSDMSITHDDDDTNNSFYDDRTSTPTNKRRGLSRDESTRGLDDSISQHSHTVSQHSHSKTGHTSTDMDPSRFDDDISESNLSKSEATPKAKERKDKHRDKNRETRDRDGRDRDGRDRDGRDRDGRDRRDRDSRDSRDSRDTRDSRDRRDDRDRRDKRDKKREVSPRKEKSKSKQSEAGSETASSRIRTTTAENTESMSGTNSLTDHQLDDTISVSKFSDVSSMHGGDRQRLESKDTIHTDATSMITIDGAISRTPSTKREKPSIDASVDDTKHSRSDMSMDKDSRLDSRHDSRHDSRDNSTRLDSRTNLTSTDADSKNGTPLLSKKGLSTDGDITPTNSRRMTSTDARSVSGISDLQDIGDSVSQRGSRRGKSIDDTMSHDSSTLHAPASITSGNMSQQVSSHMRSESEDHTTNSLHSMRTPKIEKSTAHDATSITASTTDGSINQSQSIKAEDAVSVSAASATGSTATAGTTRTKHSELNSQMSKTTSANLSSAQATADTASSHGLVPPSSDTTSISNQQLLNSQSIGADATSMTRSDQTPTNQRNSQYLTHSEGGDGKRGLNSADTMSLTTLSRHPSMMSVTSSGQMSSVSQQNRNRSSQQPKKGQNMFQFSGSETASVSSKQAPKMSRVTNIYASVHQGISDYISIFTAELNVLQTQLHMEDTPMQVKIDLEKQLNSTERILTKLQYQQNQATEIYEQYKIQEKYISKQKQLKSELQSTPEMQKLERDLESYLGRFHVKMKGLLGFARLKAGDNYEVTIKYGGQRWKLKGQVKSSFEQIWDSTDFVFKPKVGDMMAIKVAESRSVIRKQRVVGNVTCETKDLFSAELQELAIDLNSIGSLKISLNIAWSPFDPNDPSAPPIEQIMSRLQSSSDMQMGGSDLMSSGRSMISGDATSLSQSSAFGKSDTDGRSVSGSVKTETTLTNSVTASSGLRGHRSASGHGRSTMTPGSSTMDLTESESGRGGSILGEDGMIMKRIEQFEQGKYDNDEDAQQKHRDILEEIQNSMDPRPQKVFMGAEMADLGEIQELAARDHEIGQRLLDAINSLNLTLDDYRGRYRELRPLEENLQALHVMCKRGGREAPPPLSLEEQSALNAFEFLDGDNSTMIEDDLISQSYKSCRSELFEDDDQPPTTGNPLFDEALLPHVQSAEALLPFLGVYGPCRVKEIISLDKLIKHGFIIGRYLELVRRKTPLNINDLPEVKDKFTASSLWMSCCDGKQRLAVTGRIFKLEMRASYGAEVKSKHSEVADKVFPEIVRRILGISDSQEDVDDRIVTLHQWLVFYNDRDVDERIDFIKYVDRVALEIFITGMLESKTKRLVLSAVKRLQGLLALRQSNIRALCTLLLDEDKEVRNAAAAHLAHIGTDVSFREKALCSLLEMLEDDNKIVRWSATLGLGFIGCREAVKHIQYTFMADIEPEVREACKTVLISFGRDGRRALDEACCTLLAQTMSHTVHIAHRSRMGTSL